MKLISKIIIGMGTAVAIGSPALTVISCGSESTGNNLNLKDFELGLETTLGNNFETNPNFVPIKIFPDINSYDFYNYINIVNGKSYISDELISKVVKKVISSTNITDGRIYWSYNRANEYSVDIGFKWIGRVAEKSKTYKFKLN